MKTPPSYHYFRYKPSSIFGTPCRMKIHFKSKNEKQSSLEKINKYANLILVGVTFLLVIVTGIYITLSWKIANETKRLADINVAQFKIKAYPTFLISRTTPTYLDGRYKDEIITSNRGEITSFETSTLILYAIETQEKQQQIKLSFVYNWSYIYIDKVAKNIDILDYSEKILPGTGSRFGIDTTISNIIMDKLKYQIIIIRHKVPYDTLFSYEIYAFAWEIKEQNKFYWEKLPDSTRNMLFDELINSEIVAPNREEKIKEFFKDHPEAQHIKFHKKEAS